MAPETWTVLITGILVLATGLLTTIINHRYQLRRDELARQAELEAKAVEALKEFRQQRLVHPIIEYIWHYLASSQKACRAEEIRLDKEAALEALQQVAEQLPVTLARIAALEDDELEELFDGFWAEVRVVDNQLAKRNFDEVQREIVQLAKAGGKVVNRLEYLQSL